MNTEHSTYTYGGGAQETLTLTRRPATPHGHALLIIDYSDGQYVDCYVNTAWLRDRLDDLGEPHRTAHRPLTPDAITDEMVLRFMNTYDRLRDGSKDAPSLNHFTAARTSITRGALTAALTEPPARPEGAEEWEDWLIEALPHESMPDEDIARLADQIAAHLIDPTRKEA